MKTIVLACGDSKRFAEYSHCPKQFLRFSVIPGWPVAQMWENAVAGMQSQSDVVVAVRTDHNTFVDKPTILTNSTAVWLEPTRGQADTLLQTLLRIPDLYEQEIVVVNCDQGFAPGLLDRMVALGRKSRMPSALTFTASKDEASRWSYVDSHPHFQDAEEKNAIGTHALAGAYYFPRRISLVRALTRLLSWERREPYISQIYGHMSGPKLSVEIRRDDVYDWGTPSTLTAFLGHA